MLGLISFWRPFKALIEVISLIAIVYALIARSVLPLVIALALFGIEYVSYRWLTSVEAMRGETVSKNDIKDVEEEADYGLPQSEDDIYRSLKGISRQVYMRRVAPIIDAIDVIGENQGYDSLILDSGCGQGLVTKKLALPGFEVVGLDVSVRHIKSMLHWCRGLNVHGVLGDVENLPFADSTFNIIVSTEVLEHLPNPQSLFSGHSRCLRKTGSLLLTTENASGFLRSLNPFIWLERLVSIYHPGILPRRRELVMHKRTGRWYIHRSFTIRELIDWAESYGFKLTEITTTSFGLDLIYKLLASLSFKAIDVISTAERFLGAIPLVKFMGDHIYLHLTR